MGGHDRSIDGAACLIELLTPQCMVTPFPNSDLPIKQREIWSKYDEISYFGTAHLQGKRRWWRPSIRIPNGSDVGILIGSSPFKIQFNFMVRNICTRITKYQMRFQESLTQFK
jgi:hypothetical protein